jgi:hypothetical protein
MMKNIRIALMCAATSLFIACKPADNDSSAAAVKETPGNQQISSGDLATKMTPADVQEFYEIVKLFYLNRAKTQKFEDNGRFEIDYFEKFSIPLDNNEKIHAFSNNMFALMESGQFSVVLFDIPKKPAPMAVPPKGMTTLDLENFLQIVKTEYFKYIAGVPVKDFGAQELRFYARMQGVLPPAMPRQGDLLINAGDLFNRIETGK